MTTRRPRTGQMRQTGATLIEVLVSLLILLVGLLGLVGVMIQSQRAQLESYQRSQALLLVQDMASRINANRAVASCYVLVNRHIGTGNTSVPADTTCGSGTAEQKARMSRDMLEWKDMLIGAGEKVGTTEVGSVAGARGCVSLDAASGIYQVSVVWQGMSGLGAPPGGVTCGQGEFGGEARRRAVSITIMPNTLI